ncbi:hypothetical protein ACJRO7_014179, partial [Eucalyptus globulus]
ARWNLRESSLTPNKGVAVQASLGCAGSWYSKSSRSWIVGDARAARVIAARRNYGPAGAAANQATVERESSLQGATRQRRCSD